MPCPFYTITKLACPVCGISHFITDMLALRPYDAVRQNLAVAVILPIWMLILLSLVPVKITAKRERIIKYTAWVTLVFLIIFGVLRNIPYFSFLMPLYMQ